MLILRDKDSSCFRIFMTKRVTIIKVRRTIEGDVDFINGVEMIYAQMNALLKDAGVEEINVENESFKPTHHEALMKVESDLPEGTIMEEFQKGFMIGDKVIRHARVKISAGKKQDSCKNEDDDKKEENSNEKLNKKTNKSNLEE